MRLLLVAVCLLLASSTASADSPLTSTDIAEHYKDVGAVREALRTHTASGDVLDFLLNGQQPLDQRVEPIRLDAYPANG